jgi:hypothetical protein
MKLISVTWSYEDESNVKDTMLYKSFIKNNNESNFINFHFNRSNYLDLEKKFELQYGDQYDYILYKIFLLPNFIDAIDDDILIFSDTNDVVCVGSIEQILYEDGIIFSAEKHQYPNDITSWKPVFSYPDKNIIEGNFLNSGLIISEKKLYIQLLYSVIEKVLPLNYKLFGGDQGVYIYHFINEFLPKISLDDNRNIFVSTYLTSYDWYTFENDKLLYRPTNSYPMFVHDNGWNYGSPKIINRFNLI